MSENKDATENLGSSHGYRADLEGRLPIAHNGKSAEEWYTLYCKEVLCHQRLIDIATEFVTDSYRPEPKHDAERFDKLRVALGISASHGCLAICKESVEQEFRDDLTELLRRWGAEIEAEDHYPGYAECGEDIRMTVAIPALYDEHGNTVRERCDVNLGLSFGSR